MVLCLPHSLATPSWMHAVVMIKLCPLQINIKMDNPRIQWILRGHNDYRMHQYLEKSRILLIYNRNT